MGGEKEEQGKRADETDTPFASLSQGGEKEGGKRN